MQGMTLMSAGASLQWEKHQVQPGQVHGFAVKISKEVVLSDNKKGAKGSFSLQEKKKFTYVPCAYA
jgi:hypothetical protein